MARIRAQHPGQWTDDSFVSCSPLARLLALGVRNEADDNGIFEWNPTKLKMRILPADNCEITALLDELVVSNQVHRYTVAGRNYGVIRSFQRFQRPKKPTFQYPIPSEPLPDGYALSSFYSPTSSPPVPHQSPISGESSIQRGGGVVVVVNKTTSSSSSGASDSRADEQPPPPALPSGGEPSASFERLCGEHRVKLDTRARMHLTQWATEGVTAQQFADAIAIARERKPDPEVLYVRYLAPIVHELRIGTLKPLQPTGEAAIAVAMANIARREARELALMREAAAPQGP